MMCLINCLTGMASMSSEKDKCVHGYTNMREIRALKLSRYEASCGNLGLHAYDNGAINVSEKEMRSGLFISGSLCFFSVI